MTESTMNKSYYLFKFSLIPTIQCRIINLHESTYLASILIQKAWDQLESKRSCEQKRFASNVGCPRMTQYTSCIVKPSIFDLPNAYVNFVKLLTFSLLFC